MLLRHLSPIMNPSKRNPSPSLFGVIFAAFLSACSHSGVPGESLMTLNNNGGFSHSGRTIELFSDGNAQETRYTDVMDDVSTSKGTYILQGKTLTLNFGKGREETLLRVVSGSDRYWVHPENVDLIKNNREGWLRQTSLKQQSP